MPLSPRTLRPANTFTPRSISGLALWLDASASGDLYTTDAGPVVPVSSPTEIAGCALWLDASDSSTITHTGGAVSEWRDKTTNGRHYTASTTARPSTGTRTQNGLNVIDFDGVNHQMSGNAATLSMFRNVSSGHVIMVAKLDATTGNQILFRHSNGVAGHIPRVDMFTDGNSLLSIGGRRLDADSGNPYLTMTPTPTVPLIVSGHWDWANGDLFLRRDGLLAGSTASFSTDGSTSDTASVAAFVGGAASGFRMDGYIAEIIVFNTALSPADRARVEAYLAQRWGITGVHAAATSANDPVGYWRDRSGNGRHATQATAANRVTVGATTLNGRRFVAGGGDLVTPRRSLSTPSWNYAAGNTALFVFNAAALNQGIYQRGTLNDQPRAAVQGAPLELRATVGGASSTQVDGVIGYAPASWAIGATLFNTGLARAYRDGAFGTATTSNTQTWATSTPIRLFSLTDTLYGLNGGIAEFIYYDRQLSNAEVQRAARYLAAKWGIVLAPQVSNADAQDWINRVYANGGTVTASTAAAVNQFCIDTASIRDRFLRLNLFCGGTSGTAIGINSAMVPLFRGFSLGGPQYGGTFDTNNGPFSGGEYSETLGLLGGGSRWLNTGVTLQGGGLSASSVHLSAVWPTFTQPTSTNVFPIAAINSAVNERHWLNCNSNTVPTTEVGGIAGGNGALQVIDTIAGANGGVSIPGGLWTVSRTSASDIRMYRGTSERGSNTTTLSSSFGTENVSVFARWNGSSTFGHFAQRMMAYSVGLGMNAEQIAVYNAAINNFNSAMGRSV